MGVAMSSNNHTHPGHGGDGYLQFQDQEEISSAELADAFQQIWQKKRYLIMLLITRGLLFI